MKLLTIPPDELQPVREEEAIPAPKAFFSTAQAVRPRKTTEPFAAQRVTSNCDERDETNKMVLNFIRTYRDVAQQLADQIEVPVENILGLAAEQTGYGRSLISRNAHNYFGLHAGAPGSMGVYLTREGVKVSAFAADTGFLSSGQSS